jgi:hypothetical protein
MQKFEIIARCGYGDISELGTGHLTRSINVIKFLKKKNKINYKKILFIINDSNKKNDAKKIIQKLDKNIKIKFLKKKENLSSVNFINNYRTNLLIIDTLSKISSLGIRVIKKKAKKVILFDDTNFKGSGFDLKINSLLFKKNLNNKKKMYGFKFNILSPFFLKIKPIKKLKKVFIFFGGYDFNNYTKVFLSLIKKNNFKEFTFYIDKKYKNNKSSLNKNLRFFDRKNFYQHLSSSEVIFCSGGLVAFDSIYFNKKVFCIPQFNHQKLNIIKLMKMNLVKRISINDIQKILNYRNKFNFSVNNILNQNMINKTLKKINNTYRLAKIEN